MRTKGHNAFLRCQEELSSQVPLQCLYKIGSPGPIILQKAVEVEKGDTPEVLQHRVMEQAEWKILPKAIDMIANGEI